MFRRHSIIAMLVAATIAAACTSPTAPSQASRAVTRGAANPTLKPACGTTMGNGTC